MAAWNASDQTQEEFARAHGLKVGTLRNWIRQQGRFASSLPAKVELREIKLDEVFATELSAASWELEIRLPGGITLAVGRHTPAERIRQVVEALRC